MSYSARRRLMFITLALVYQLVFLHVVVMTTVANDVMRDLALTPTTMGLLGSAYLYTYSAIMLVSGMLAAWLGPRKLLTGLFFISGAGGIIFAQSNSLEIAMLGRALCGFGLAATMTSSFTIFGRWYPASHYSRICAWYFAIGGLGALIGLGPLSMLNAVVGWRSVFQLLGILTLVYSVIILAVVRDWPPAAVAALTGAEVTSGQTMTLGELWRGVRMAARSADFWRVLSWFLLLPGMYFAFCGLWAVPYLKDVYHMTHGEAGGLVSLVSIGFIAGSPLVSALCDKVFHSYRMAAGGTGVLAMLGTLMLVFWVDSMSTTTLAILMLMLGLALNAPNAVLYAAARNLFGARLSGVLSGVYGWSSFVGGGFLQVLSGWILSMGEARQWSVADSYAMSFVPFLFCGLVTALAGFKLSPASFKASV